MEIIQTPATTKTQKCTRKNRILEELIESGYQDQNTKLVKAGYLKIAKNLRLLKENNGDLEAVLKIIEEKKAKNALRIQKHLERAGTKNKRSKRSKSERPCRKAKDLSEAGEPEGVISEMKIELEVPAEKKEKKFGKREKGERREMRYKKERTGEEIAKKYEEWPAGIKRVYLDGNNMLFADGFLRKLRLNRQQKEAEEALSKLASNFAVRLGNFDLVLIYDDITIKCVKETLISAQEKPLEFEILGARPKYSTSDDALVEWIGNLSNPQECLVVSSDVGLQVRLKEKGVEHLMKTGNWFAIAKQVLGEEYTKIADSYSVPIEKAEKEDKEDNKQKEEAKGN